MVLINIKGEDVNMKKQKVLIIGYDGYIGFPLTMRLLLQDHAVYGIDDFSRRKAVAEMNSMSASTIHSPERRRELLYRIGKFQHYGFNTLFQKDQITKLIKRFKFDTIINLAHNPSAPYSQIDKAHAEYVLQNNILTTNSLLWDIHEHSPESHYITIGSTGEYNHYLNIDIEEGYFEFEHKGRQSKKCLFPREGNSIYHNSKIASTYLIDYLSKLWNLKCTDVMQSVVFGMYTDESDRYKEFTRVDSDDAFGTVINRFVVQSMLGESMTIYGHGKHQRGFIALNDSIQALVIAVENPAQKGSVQTWNQLSEWHSMEAVSEMVKEVIPNANAINIDSPRHEFTGGHHYHYVSEKLKDLGYKPTRSIKQEIQYMVDNIDLSKKTQVLKSVIKPKVIF